MGFWEQFWPEFAAAIISLFFGIPITIFATFLGAGLGVLGAFWLHNRMQREIEAKTVEGEKSKS